MLTFLGFLKAVSSFCSSSLGMDNIARFFPQRRQVVFHISSVSTRNYYVHLHQFAPKPSSVHTVFAFIIPVLFNFLDLQYQGKSHSPFETHPITMWVCITCMLAYCLSLGTYTAASNLISDESSIYATALRQVLLLFGTLAFTSLASVIFPNRLRPFLYVLYTFLSIAGVLHHPVKVFCKWVREVALRTVQRASRYGYWPALNSSAAQRLVLPV